MIVSRQLNADRRIDQIGVESPQRRVGNLPNVRRPAVEADGFAALELESKLRRDYHLIANTAERLADDLFVREGPIRFGGIEKRDPTVNSRADDRDFTR